MDIQKILDHYVICALWSSTNEEDEPLDSFYTIDDIDTDTLSRMREDIMDFVESNKELLVSSGQSEEMIGYDFWLTRNHHGAGFWDRGLGNIGEELTKVCYSYGSVYLYISDNGKVCQ